MGVWDGEDEAVLLGISIRIPKIEIIGTVIDVASHRRNRNADAQCFALGATTEDEGAALLTMDDRCGVFGDGFF